MNKLTFIKHSRNFYNYTYVYPVLSRRSQGISLGINLNVNNACNWRCVYCQVEGLIRGKPTEIDLVKLESELDDILNKIIYSDFIKEYAPPDLQRFNDISISGNGEPTLSKQFVEVIQIIAKLKQKYNICREIKTILITNGSEVSRPHVIKGLQLLNKINGEVWFKIDSVTESGTEAINQVHISQDNLYHRLQIASSNCETFIQTCWFKTNNIEPTTTEISQYIDFIIKVKEMIAGVLMYSVARAPALDEGQNVSSVGKEFLEKIANQLENHKISVKYYP